MIFWKEKKYVNHVSFEGEHVYQTNRGVMHVRGTTFRNVQTNHDNYARKSLLRT